MRPKKKISRHSRDLRRKKKINNFAIFLSIFLFIIIGLALILQIDRILIKKVTIEDERTIGENEIAGVVLNKITGRYFWLYPKNNSFIYPKKSLIASLKNNFIKIEDVVVSLPNLETMKVEIKERDAVYIWCESGTLGCFYADQNGYIFDRAPDFSGGVFLKFEGGLPSGKGFSYYLSKHIMPTERIKMLAIFKDRVEKIVASNFSDKWKAVSFVIGEGDDLELNFENGEKSQWKIMIAPRVEEKYQFTGTEGKGVLSQEDDNFWSGFGGDLEAAEQNLKTTLKSDAFKESAINKDDLAEGLQYIDLRFGKKIFYKFDK